MSDQRRARWVRLFIVLVKLVTATIELVSALVLLTLSSGALQRLVNRLLAHEAVEDPHDLLVRLVHEHLAKVLTDKTTIAAVLLVLAVAKIVGAIGLLKRRPWGYVVLLVLVVLLVPVDVYRAVSHPTVAEGLLLALNVVILALLIRFRAALMAREASPARVE
jgi:uncharacterized membrane protein